MRFQNAPTRRVAALVLAACILRSGTCFAEDDEADRKAADPSHFDYAVPDAPAFELLGASPDAILRPGTRREIAMVLDKADLKNFGIECAPFLLARDGRVSLSEYQQHRQRFNLRASFGARTVNDATSAAVGLRWSIKDSGDPYTDQGLIAAAAAAGRRIQKYLTTADDNASDHVLSSEVMALIPPELRDDVRKIAATRGQGVSDAYQALPDSVKSKIRPLFMGPGIDEAEAEYDAARTRFKDEWNRTIVECGVAAGGRGTDSLGSKARATAYGGWLVGGQKLGAGGQLIAGGDARLVRDDSTGVMDEWTGGAAVRVYYGSNRAKVAGGGDIAWKTNGLPTYGGELRGEINLVPSIWVMPVVRLNRNELKRPELSAQLSLRVASLGVIPAARLLAPDQWRKP
jgi:hypothetical protein